MFYCNNLWSIIIIILDMSNELRLEQQFVQVYMAKM